MSTSNKRVLVCSRDSWLGFRLRSEEILNIGMSHISRVAFPDQGVYSVCTWRHSGHVSVRKQWNGGHICWCTQLILRELGSIILQTFSLFHWKNKVTDQVSENTLMSAWHIFASTWLGVSCVFVGGQCTFQEREIEKRGCRSVPNRNVRIASSTPSVCFAPFWTSQ